MRKPLVVVCVTASAVLLAGAIAATTAGADTTPDEPGVALTGIPGVPQLPADEDDEEPAALPAVPGLDLPGLAASTDPAPATTAGVNPADEPAGGPQRPGGQKPAADQAAPAVQAAEPQAEPAQTKADEPKQKPDARPLRQDAGGQKNVSPGMLSSSASAPVQRQVLSLVNENRRDGGCENLTLDSRLIAAANRHAADMARRGYFAHESLNGDGAGDRVQDAGYDWKRYGENIARGQDSAAEVVDGWMNSSSHRENIMDCSLRQMGIGLAFDDDKTPYWVQDFATPH